MQNDYINTTVLPDKKKGHFKIDHNIDELDEEITVDGIDNKWVISSGEHFFLYEKSFGKWTPVQKTKLDGGTEVQKTVLDDGTVIKLKWIAVQETMLDNGTVEKKIVNSGECRLTAETIVDEKNKFVKLAFVEDIDKKLSQTMDKIINIGRNENNTIVLRDMMVSDSHASIYKKDGKWFLCDNGSANGTYLNSRKIESHNEYELNIGDVVFILGYKFVICADFISANIDEKCIGNSRISSLILKGIVRTNKKNSEYTDYFYRTVDLEENKPDFKEIVLLPPERKRIGREENPMLAMGPAATMGTSTLLVAMYSGIASHYRGTNISYVVPTFIMAGSMILSSVIWPLIIRKHKHKEMLNDEKERISNYQEYIMDLSAKVKVMQDKEKKYLCEKNLTVDQCIERVKNRDRYLWSKSINDADFMSVAIGTGEKASEISVKYHEDNDVFFKDQLRYDMMQFANEKRYVSNVPITISLNNGCICGISGERELSFNLVKQIVIQLTSLYSYDELKLIFIFNENEKEKWEYAKWLPHVWKNDNSFRYIASDSDDMKELSTELEKEIQNRKSHADIDFPKILIIASDKKMMEDANIMTAIMKERNKLNFSILTSFGMYNYNNSNLIIEVGNDVSKLYDRTNNIVTEFKPYTLKDESDFETYLDKISNIKLDISTEQYQFPKMVTFLDMFRVSKVDHLNCISRWTENNPIKSLKTEIGVSPSGDVFFIDLHEKFHGPHGLIAGTTGSGKSETIITIILSLAVNYSPEEVAFVIIDYKGGGLADAFDGVQSEYRDGKYCEIPFKLPHVVGTVTNLDGDTIERACISIDTEVKRRQVLFKEARKLSNEGTMDIYKYQQLRREGMALDPLPHLFIVCDEFAELKGDAKRSDFMDLLVSTARIGRSLGVHLILATQKPDSVVGPQIWSNSRFKICLKVQDKSDSKAVINCPDAAEISTTGRFFFQVGYNEVFSMGQSAWCGADYFESDEFVQNDVESVEVISNTGAVLYEKIRKINRKPNASEHPVSQLVAVRNYLIDIAKDIKVRPLWLAPIPSKLSLRQLYSETKAYENSETYVLNPIIGKRDDLYNRRQEVMTIPFSEKGNLIVYGAAGSGLDMFFVSMLYSLIYAYTPEQVNIYVLDFDTGFLKTFLNAPHVGNVVVSDNDLDVRNVIDNLKEEISRRNKLFEDYMGDYSNYCTHSGKKLPNIVLVLNNFVEYMEKFGKNENDFQSLIYIAREGIKRGIFLVIGSPAANVNFRLKQYIQQIFMLKMNSNDDYTGIVGRTGGITPPDYVGGGIVKENDITYKFQTADIFDIVENDDDDDEKQVSQDALKEVKQLCAYCTEKYKNFTPAVSYTELNVIDTEEKEEEIHLSNNTDIDYSCVPIGVNKGNQVKYNFKDKYITFVLSCYEDILSLFADYLARTLSKDKNISVVLIDCSGRQKDSEENFEYYSTRESLTQWNAEYKQIAEERTNLLAKDKDGSYFMTKEEKHIYVIINSFNDICEIDDTNVTINNFKNVITQLPEIYVHYIILDTPEKMNAERGAYYHIVKDISGTDIEHFENFDVENHRDWFDESVIWLADIKNTGGLLELENPVSVSRNQGVTIRNNKIENIFNFFK